MSFLGLAAVFWGLSASAQTTDLTDDEKKVIGERVAPTVNYDRKLTLEKGGTVFVVRTVKVSAKKLTGPESDYQVLVADVRAPKGVVVHANGDDWKFEKKGDKVEVTIRYALHATPDASAPKRKRKSQLFAKLTLLERKGFANVVASSKIRHSITIVSPKPTAADLAADFRGYRVYKKLSRERRNKLAARGVTGLSLKDRKKLPELVRTTSDVVVQVNEFAKWRRRMWVAKRHLLAASKSSDRATAQTAKQYLAQLDKKESELQGLPTVALVPAAGAIAEGVSKLPDAKKVEPKKKTRPGEIEELAPLETKKDEEPREQPYRREEPKEKKAEAKKEEPRVVEDVLSEIKRREEVVEVYTRGLVLDDPNVGFAFSTRFNWATPTVRGEDAIAPAWFFFGQAGLTKELGAELTVPVSYVVVDLPREPNLFYMGNPLLAVKYRFFLPKLAGRRPVILPRIRWGIPLSAQQSIPPTRLQAAEFTVSANFVDTYAFLLEKHDIGAGFSAAWDISMVAIGVQSYLDYYLSVGDSEDPLNFWAFHYGLSVGVRPIDQVGAFLEARGTALLDGPKRHELFTYFGVRGYLFDHIEPAIWGSVPVGSINGVTGFQFGVDLRFVYDLEGLIVRGSGTRRADVIEGL